MLYEYECPNGHIFEEYHPASESGEPQQCHCGQLGQRVYTTSALINPDLEPFTSTSGQYITSRKQWRDHLKKTDAIEFGHSDLEAMRNRYENKKQNFHTKEDKKDIQENLLKAMAQEGSR